MIDLRSDTVTRPGPAMREAMANAEVGDDVYGEDPSVIALQEEAARRFGKEAALFVPSGTMANQAALHCVTRPGDVVLASVGAHILRYESGAAAALSGLQIQTIGSEGRISTDDLDAVLLPPDPHHAPATVLAIENTHNFAGGRIFPFSELSSVVELARARGLSTHLDGARIFNAQAATGVPVAQWASLFDTVAFCLSKGLGAPVGSLVVGDRETISQVHRARKRMGGGMRQAGILAAAGLYALENHVDRLADDHANAIRLAEGLERRGLRVEARPETNIVMFEVADARDFVRRLAESGVRMNAMGPRRVRAVTHLDVTAVDIDRALERIPG